MKTYMLQRVYSDNNHGGISPGKLLLGTGAVASVPLTLGYLPDAKTAYYNYIHEGAPVQKKIDYFNIKLELGDIVSSNHGSYSHYGVVSGFSANGKPIITNYDLMHKMDPRKSSILNSTLEDFAHGGRISIEKPNGKFTPQQISQRAKEAFEKNNFGNYSLASNNCEHFARLIANGERTSNQVKTYLKKYIPRGVSPVVKERILRTFSAPAAPTKHAFDLLRNQGQHLLATDGFNIRKHLSKDLGGLSHFDKYQTTYISGGGSVLGGLTGRLSSRKKAEREAQKYGLTPGTIEYDNFIRQRMTAGTLKGAAIGGGIGLAGSKGIDAVRGKIISDKARVQKGIDLGNNYLGLGKSFRGVKSSDDIDKVVNNWNEISSYGKSLLNGGII